MTTITYWAIKRKTDGFYLPQPIGRNGRGGSYMEPTDPKEPKMKIRFFHSQIGAKNALTAWLKGEHLRSWGPSSLESFFDDGEELIDVKPRPDRKREDMEIVELKIKLP